MLIPNLVGTYLNSQVDGRFTIAINFNLFRVVRQDLCSILKNECGR